MIVNVQLTYAKLEKYLKSMIKSYILKYDDPTLNNNDKTVIGSLLLYTIKSQLWRDGYLSSSIDTFIHNNYKTTIAEVKDLKDKNTIRYRNMIAMVNDKFNIENFDRVDDKDIMKLINADMYNNLNTLPTDEIFSIHMFNNNDSNIILTKGTINNAKRLYDTILYPILMYYKRTMALPKDTKILYIEEGIVSSNTLQSKGSACVFNLMNLHPSIIYDDIQDGYIDIDYGLMAVLDNGLYISLPYLEEGTLITHQAL